LAFALKFNTYFLVKKLSGQSLESPSAYLTQLRRYSERVHVQNTSSFRLYGMGIALALAFFSLEIYFVIPFFWFMFLMGFVVLWFIVACLVFAKQYVHHEKAKLQDIVEELERINEQLP